jgi:hypothetical protein
MHSTDVKAALPLLPLLLFLPAPLHWDNDAASAPLGAARPAVDVEHSEEDAGGDGTADVQQREVGTRRCGAVRRSIVVGDVVSDRR